MTENVLLRVAAGRIFKKVRIRGGTEKTGSATLGQTHHNNVTVQRPWTRAVYDNNINTVQLP